MKTEEPWKPIELNENTIAEIGRLNEKQLRFLVCQLAFPEAQVQECAEAAGYAQPKPRGSELRRKEIVRELTARCVRKVRDGLPEDVESMTQEDLIRFHEGVIRDPRGITREKQASARDLAELRKWIKGGSTKASETQNMQDILESWRDREQSAA